MATMYISLPDLMKDWVEAQAETGRYANLSDYVRDLIRRDQKKAEKIARLQKLITEGIESGPAEEFDPQEFLLRMRREHAFKNW